MCASIVIALLDITIAPLSVFVIWEPFIKLRSRYGRTRAAVFQNLHTLTGGDESALKRVAKYVGGW